MDSPPESSTWKIRRKDPGNPLSPEVDPLLNRTTLALQNRTDYVLPTRPLVISQSRDYILELFFLVSLIPSSLFHPPTPLSVPPTIDFRQSSPDPASQAFRLNSKIVLRRSLERKTETRNPSRVRRDPLSLSFPKEMSCPKPFMK